MSPDHGYLPAMGRDALLPLYDLVSRLLGVDELHERLIEQAAVEPGQRVLEVGCGTGSLTLRGKRAQPAAEFVGLDPDPRALARARRKAEKRGLAVRFDRGFAQTLPNENASFDRVLSSLMLHHLETGAKRAMLEQIGRVLRPGGTLHLLDFDGAVEPDHGLVARRLHGGPRLRDNVPGRIPALMAEAGLADVAAVAHLAKRPGRVTFYRAGCSP